MALWFAAQVAMLKAASAPYLYCFYAILSGALIGVLLDKVLGGFNERKV